MHIIEILQSIRTPTLDLLFKALTLLGNQQFYVLLLPVAYWTWRKQTMQQLTVLLLVSFALNAFLKNALALPRPPLVYHLVNAEGYGLPSGHAQGAITLWGFVWLSTSKKWLRWLTGFLIVGIALSRIYLGVHYPRDVVAGLVLGGIWLGLFWYFKDRIWEHWHLSPFISISALFGGVALLVLTTPTRFGGTVGGVVLGMFSGMLLDNTYLRFYPMTSLRNNLMKTVVGIIGILVLYTGLKLIFPGSIIYRVIRYTFLGLWLGLLAPWLFVKLGLADQSD